MKKIILITLLTYMLLPYKNIYSQSSYRCNYDVVKYQFGNSQKQEIYYLSTRFGGDEYINNSYNNMTYLIDRLWILSFYQSLNNNYDADCESNNFTYRQSIWKPTTVSFYLKNKGNVVETIFSKTYSSGNLSQIEQDYRNHIENTKYTFLNNLSVEISNNYQLILEVDVVSDESNGTAYTNPLRITNSSTYDMTLGRGPKIYYPIENETNVDLTPTIKWENLTYYNRTTPPYNFDVSSYRLRIKETSDNSNTYVYDTNVSGTEKKIPANVLEPNTKYSVFTSVSVLGETFHGFSTFTTRSLLANFKELDFYTQTTPNPNNPNNYLNKNLPIRFKVKVENELTQNLPTLKGTISTTTAGVTITDNKASFNNVASGSAAWSTDEFEIQVDESVASGTTLEFKLTVDDEIIEGGPWESYFSFPIEPLGNGIVLLDDDDNPDSNGDDDDIPEPGETVEILPTLNNLSQFNIATVKGKMTTEDDFITIWDDKQGTSGTVKNEWRYNLISNVQEPIEVNATNKLPEFDFVFEYPANETLQELNFNLNLEGNLNDSSGTLLRWQTNFVYNEGIEPPPTVVSFSPANNATDIEIDSNLSFTLNQNTTAVAGKNIKIYKENGSLIETIEATDTKIVINEATVTIDPTKDLVSNTSYYVLIDAGAFINASNQPFAGIQNTTSWVFTTVDNTTCSNTWDSPTIYNTYTRALGIVTIDGETATAEDKVAAFVGDELRGVSDIVINDNKAYMNLSIQGNVIETATFKVWDTSECEEVPVSFSTQTDPPNTIGSPTFLSINALRTTAGIENSGLTNAFNIYPNPTKSILRIEQRKFVKINSIELFNVLGEKITEKFNDYQTIDISRYANGVYFLKFKTDKGSVTQKIVKQ